MSNVEFTKKDFEIVGKNIDESEKIVRKSLTYWQDAWRRLKENKLAILGLIIILTVLIMSIFVPIFTKFTYDFQDYNAMSQSPSADHI